MKETGATYHPHVPVYQGCNTTPAAIFEDAPETGAADACTHVSGSNGVGCSISLFMEEHVRQPVSV